MAVKVHCNICDKFIKDIEQFEFQKLTGKEICAECGTKVKEVYDQLDEMTAKFRKQLDDKNANMVRTYKTLDTTYKKYMADIQSFYTTRSAALDRRMEDIL